jgi:hypothetical protein
MRDFELLPQFVQKSPQVYFAVSVSPSSVVEAATHGFSILIPAYLGTPIELCEGLMSAYRDEYRKRWNVPGRILLGVNFYGIKDEHAAIAMGSPDTGDEVFARNMLLYKEKFSAQYAAYPEITGCSRRCPIRRSARSA